MGHKVCADKNCRGFGGYHIENCKRKAIVAKAKIGKDTAVLKGFQYTIC